ncbi:MAG TPA: zeta toxin family protein, partial [Kofleriaceae bacterium]|nr:zeta toxin family protein [Kofleriaceae bacterium]
WGGQLRTFDELADPLDFENFTAPGGVLDSELSGREWVEVRILLCGTPETPEQVRYVTKMRVDFETSGIIGGGLMAAADAVGLTDTHSDLLAQEERFDDHYAGIPERLRNRPLSELGDEDADTLQRLAEYLQQDAEAYGAVKAAIVDAVVTTLEIIAGVLATIATAGASSPVLAAIIANLIISAAGIAVRAAALGDAYGTEQFAQDFVLAIGTAGIAAAEAKVFSRLATSAANRIVRRTAVEAIEEGGLEVAEGGVRAAARGRQVLHSAVQGSLRTVMTQSATTVLQTVTADGFWEQKLSEMAWGENSLGAQLIKGIPRHMAAGFVSGALEPFASSRRTWQGTSLARALQQSSANTAGILMYVDSYQDASAFWDQLLASNLQSIVRGAFDGIAGHAARARELARDLAQDQVTAADLDAMDWLSEAERRQIAEIAHAQGHADKLPSGYRQFLPTDEAPPATDSAPETTTAPTGAATGEDSGTPAHDDDGETRRPAHDEGDADSETTPRTTDDSDASDTDEHATGRPPPPPDVDGGTGPGGGGPDDTAAYNDELLLNRMIDFEREGRITQEQIDHVMDGETWQGRADRLATLMREIGEPVGVRPGAGHAERVETLGNSGGTLSTVDAFTTAPVPGGGAIWDFVADPANWTSERQALHRRLLDQATADAMAFADASEPGTLFAMRGNTGAGKSRATAEVTEMQPGREAADGRLHANVNPDNFKVDLVGADGVPVTSSQVHVESSMLAQRLQTQLAGTTDADGNPVSFVVDKRLGSTGDVSELAEIARTTGRQLHLMDVDAPLEFSLVGVLMRTPGGDSPIPPFDVIGSGGMQPARENRLDVMQMFIAEPSLGRYQLSGTEPSGAKVPVAEVVNGVVTIHNQPMFDQLTSNPAAQIAALKTRVIDDAFITEFTAQLPSGFGADARAALEPHMGLTFEAAIRAHSQATPDLGGGDGGD